jgi:predicted nucleic acid-binding protein
VSLGGFLLPEGWVAGKAQVDIWQLRHNFSMYDAAYIVLAETLSAVLVTRDRRLASAGHSATVEVF